MNSLPLISIVVPCYNEYEVFSLLRSRLAAIADELADRYRIEFVIVDDGSRDNTWSLIGDFSNEDSRVRGFSLSRNFGHQAALTCGYDQALGEAVICMDADLQDPPETIPRMIEAWENGAEVVIAVRDSRDGESIFKRWTASLFYRLIHYLCDTEMTVDAGDFRLMDRRSVDAFNSLREHHRYIRGMVGWVGFKTATIHYHRHARAAGSTKFPFWKMISFAIDALISFSFAPLRLAFLLAAVVSLPVFVYLVYSIVAHVYFAARFEPGWASLIFAVTLFSVLNLFCLGVMGEYIGRLYTEVKGRPIYILGGAVTGTGNSDVSLKPEKALGSDDVVH